MKIIKRSKALKLLKDNDNYIKEKYCNGHYKWTGKEADYIGKPVRKLLIKDEEMIAVFVERRHNNSEGAYAMVMCIVDKKDLLKVIINRGGNLK